MKTTDAPPRAIAHSRSDDADFNAVLQEAAQGDHCKFEELHARFHNLVFSTAYSVLNNVHDAEDVTQEVFTSAYRKGALYNPARGSAKTWLASVARNRAIDRLRSKNRRYQLNEEIQEETSPDDWKESDDVESQVRLGEESQILRSAVLQLSPEQRQVIEMTYFMGFSQSEAAQELGAPLGTVKARARRGLIKLRSIVPKLD